MSTLIAAQHLYTSLPANQSPSGRSGYQTLAHTPGLSEAAVRAIRERSQYTTTPGDPLKRQFYPLPGGLHAISQIVPLPELDEFGRRGRYLAHTLVVDAMALQALGYCPLDVFSQFTFAATPEQALALCRGRPGELPPAQLEVRLLWPSQALQAAQGWPSESLVRLGRLAWQAKRLSERGESIALSGKPEEQLEILALLFFLAGPRQRLLLSFDTHAAGCGWGKGVYFWAQGYVDQPEGHPVHQVRPGQRGVNSALSPAEDSPFAVWMVRRGLSNGLTKALWQQQAWAERLEAALAGAASPVDDALPDGFVAEFARMNAAAVAERWIDRLPPGLSAELRQSWIARVVAEPGTYLQVLIAGVQPPDLHWFVLQRLLALGKAPDRSDRYILEKWIRQSGSLPLLSLLPLWDKDGRTWARDLNRLSAEDYEQVLSQVIKWNPLPLPLWQALTPQHAAIWVRLAGPQLSGKEWKKALPALEKLGDLAVDEITRIEPRLDAPSRLEISHWLKGYKGSAPRLRQMFQSTRPPRRGKKIWPF